MADITKPVKTELTFTDLSSGSPTSYGWNFGDGSPPVSTTSKTVKHTYTVAGTYTITHQVTGAGGTTTCTKTIEITAAAGFPVIVVIPVAVCIIGGLIYILTQKSGGK